MAVPREPSCIVMESIEVNFYDEAGKPREIHARKCTVVGDHQMNSLFVSNCPKRFFSHRGSSDGHTTKPFTRICPSNFRHGRRYVRFTLEEDEGPRAAVQHLVKFFVTSVRPSRCLW